MKKLQNRKGFTLVELLIVLAIIGILVLVAVPRFAQTTEASKVRSLQANVRTIASAAGLYMADKNGTEPTTIQDLVDSNYLNDNLNDKPKDATYALANGTVTGQITLKKAITLADFPGVTDQTGNTPTTATAIQFAVKFA